MPRAPRLEFKGAIYHVMARGNRREDIVRDDEDRQLFVDTFGEACLRAGWEVFAWVLMNNHYHAVFRTPQANLVEGMAWMQNTYTRRLNGRHRLWGHLFGGRYRSLSIDDGQANVPDSGDYLTSAIDYVHLNPARAGIVDGRRQSLMEYRWSSLAQGYLVSPSKRPPWLSASEGLGLLNTSDTATGRRRLLERLDGWIREERDGDAIEGALFGDRVRRGWFWGTEQFKERMLKRLSSKQKKPGNRNYRGSELQQDHSRRTAKRIIEEALKHYGMTDQELSTMIRGDCRRASVAWAIARHTTLSRGWIAKRLKLKNAANASLVIRRFVKSPDRTLPPTVRQWKKLKDAD